MLECSGGLQIDSGVNGQVSTRLEIATLDWPEGLAIKLATVCVI